MAVYIRKCRACNFEWEVSHSINENPEYNCVNCGSSATFNKITPTRTIFKGGGWAGRTAEYDRMGVPEHVRAHADQRL